jgi:hypothetical protein
MITFFTIPKPFNGIYDIIQKNAILSWQKLTPKCEIIVFGDDPSVIQFANHIDVKCITNFKSNEYGTPLLDDIWQSAKSISSNDTICYINSDIILFPDFAEKIRTIKFKEFLIAGRRWDINIDELIDFKSDWVSTLKNMIEQKGLLHAETGVDYFLFPKFIMPEMPPFAIGRGWWDNWLIHYFRKNKIPVIDGTNIMTIHQNHDYSHVKSVMKGTSEKGLERTHNGKLSNLKFSNILYISDSTYYWHKGGIYRTPLTQKMSRIYFRYIRPYLQKIKVYFYK